MSTNDDYSKIKPRRTMQTLRIRQRVNAGVLSVKEALEVMRSVPGGRDTSAYAWLLRKSAA